MHLKLLLAKSQLVQICGLILLPSGNAGCQIDTAPFFYNKSSLQSFFSL